MNRLDEYHAEIRRFEEAHGYDAEYLHDLADRSPAAAAAFSAAQPLLNFRSELPADAYYIAAATVMQEVDCGPCLELNLKLAIAAGVPRELLQTMLDSPDDLPEELGDVHRYAVAVSRHEPIDAEAAGLEDRYGRAAFAELAVCVAAVRFYPLLKRALLKEAACATGVAAP